MKVMKLISDYSTKTKYFFTVYRRSLGVLNEQQLYQCGLQTEVVLYRPSGRRGGRKDGLAATPVADDAVNDLW